MARARVDRDLNRIIVKASLADKERLASVPGCSWHKATDSWRLPLTWAACLQLRGVFRGDLELDESLIAWAWEFRRDFLQPVEAIREALSLDIDDEISIIIDRVEENHP